MCRLQQQDLRLRGAVLSVEARVDVQLKLPDVQQPLVLAEQEAPSLVVLSGLPSKLEAKSKE